MLTKGITGFLAPGFACVDTPEHEADTHIFPNKFRGRSGRMCRKVRCNQPCSHGDDAQVYSVAQSVCARAEYIFGTKSDSPVFKA